MTKGADPVLLKPWFIWRVIGPGVAVIMFLVAVGVVDRTGPEVGLAGWFFFGLALLMALAAFRQRVEIRGTELTRRGTFHEYPALSVDQVREVSFRYESGLKDFPHRVLWLYGGHRPQAFSLRWWGKVDPLAVWLLTYRSHREGADMVFNLDLDMDGKTERRLHEAARGLRQNGRELKSGSRSAERRRR
jgi:hypothetical protein